MSQRTASRLQSSETDFAFPHFINTELGFPTPQRLSKQQFGLMNEAAGALLSTGEDLSKFLLAALKPEVIEPIKLRNALILQQEPHSVGQKKEAIGRVWEGFEGLGLTLTRSGSAEFFSKDGANFGSSSTMIWNKKLGIGLIILLNVNDDGGEDFSALIAKLYQMFAATPEVLKKERAERQFFKTYKALHSEGEDTSESRMIKSFWLKQIQQEKKASDKK